MSDSNDELLTLLRLSPVGVPPYASRGLSQSLDMIQASQQLRRTVNGTLRDLSAQQFRKYKSSITCEDQQPPPFGGLWPGMELVVDCVSRLTYAVGGTAERDVVEGSERTEGGFVSYRPRLTMKVAGFTSQEDEFGATINWTLDLEEV